MNHETMDIAIAHKFDYIGSKTALGKKAWEDAALGRKNKQEMNGGNRQWWKRLERMRGHKVGGRHWELGCVECDTG